MLVRYLLQHALRDEEALLRRMACFSLMRYSDFVMQFSPNDDDLFKPVLRGLLHAIVVDRSRLVQKHACAAISAFIEVAQERILPVLQPCLLNLMTAVPRYSASNLRCLLDAIGQLARIGKTRMQNPAFGRLVVIPIMERWEQVDDKSYLLVSILECIGTLAANMGAVFRDFVQPIFSRVLYYLELISTQYRSQNDADAPSKDIWGASYDALCGLCEGMGEEIAPLIDERVLQLISYGITDTDEGLQQSGLAAVGEIAKSAMPKLAPFVDRFVPLAFERLYTSPEQWLVTNNAAWALGEIAVRADLSRYLANVIPRLLRVLQARMKPFPERASLNATVSVTIGRFALHHASALAPNLQGFGGVWCAALAELTEHGWSEKEHSFRGLCLVVLANPSAAPHFFEPFCRALASWERPPPPLIDLFRRTLAAVRTAAAGGWPALASGVSARNPKYELMLRSLLG
jgi:transportin-1